jgi:ABC-type bacteriocin/lantibiotic exporter with double-glycine peptidase domain
MTAKRVGTVVLICVTALSSIAVTHVDGHDEGEPGHLHALDSVVEPYEVLSPDASYCGPRILYFFARYTRRECTLEEVVNLCEINSDGTIDLDGLARAAVSLDLDPLLIECRAEQLLELGGPAILCIKTSHAPPDQDQPSGVERVHFVGLVRSDGDGYRLMDPSVSMGGQTVSGRAIEAGFAGRALLLRGCPRPVVRPAWVTWVNVMVLLFSVAAIACGGTVFVRRAIAIKGRRRSASTIAKGAS